MTINMNYEHIPMVVGALTFTGGCLATAVYNQAKKFSPGLHPDQQIERYLGNQIQKVTNFVNRLIPTISLNCYGP